MPTIHIAIDGSIRLSGEYDPRQAGQLAAEIDRQLPALRRQGRVAIWAETPDGVAHLINPNAGN